MRNRFVNSKKRSTPGKVKYQIPSIIEWIGIGNVITLGFLVTLIFVMVSGLSVVLTAHQNRFAFNELQELKDKANELETEWGRLLIEQSTFGVEGRIEQKAVSQLRMQLPNLSEIVMVTYE